MRQNREGFFVIVLMRIIFSIMKNNTRQKLKKIFIWICVILALPIIAVIGLYLFLPLIIESSAPSLARFYGIADLAIRVETLSWNDVDIREIKIGTAERSGVSVGKIRFIRSLSADQPHKIVISDAVIEFDSQKGRFFIPGVDFPASNPKIKSKKTVPITSLLKLPSALKPFMNPSIDVKIENSSLILRRIHKSDSSVVKLPCNMHLTVDRDGVFNFKLNAELDDLNKKNPLVNGISCRKVGISLVSEGVLREGQPSKGVSAKLAVLFTDLKFKDKTQIVSIPELKVSGEVQQDGELLRGKIFAEFANVNVRSGDLKLSNISAELPFEFLYSNRLSFSKQPSKEPGFIKVGGIEFGEKSFGSAEMHYVQSVSSLILTGKYQGIISENRASLKGEIQLPFNGEVASAKFEIYDADIEDEEKGLFIKNLNIGFHIPDFAAIRSAPAQKLSFDSLKYGEIELGKGELQFQLESKKSFFLEKSEIEWCGGHVDFGAIRIDFDKPENVDFTFYCDRVNVSEFLNQLKVAKAAGNGRVAGRIPIKYGDGKLVIRNGFLYSTPGEGGRIQLIEFAGTELADSNLQLTIAKEALKDYNYKWLRLTFNTGKGNLMMKLELDGAPNRELPFTVNDKNMMIYDKDANAKFHGVSFDLNFSIPIDDIIYYGKKTGSLLGR